jgi:hypothetical protein
MRLVLEIFLDLSQVPFFQGWKSKLNLRILPPAALILLSVFSTRIEALEPPTTFKKQIIATSIKPPSPRPITTVLSTKNNKVQNNIVARDR